MTRSVKRRHFVSITEGFCSPEKSSINKVEVACMAASFALEPKPGSPETFIKASPARATIIRLGTVLVNRVSIPVILSKQQA